MHSWLPPLLGLFFLVQLFLPLSFYVFDTQGDDRFCWRMFSADRELDNCYLRISYPPPPTTSSSPRPTLCSPIRTLLESCRFDLLPILNQGALAGEGEMVVNLTKM
jgi:hypothetical protein